MFIERKQRQGKQLRFWCCLSLAALLLQTLGTTQLCSSNHSKGDLGQIAGKFPDGKNSRTVEQAARRNDGLSFPEGFQEEAE